MAIIYSYPNGGSAIASDKLTISRSSLDAPIPNPTFTLTVAQIAAFVRNQLGTGTTNTLPIWSDGPNSVLGDSQLKQVGPSLGTGLYQIRMDNTDRFIINKPSSVTSGDPEYLIQQDGNYKVSMGWDDDGAGYGYLYNWAGDGWRFGSAGNNPELTIVTTAGNEGVTIANNLTVGGTGNFTGQVTIPLTPVANTDAASKGYVDAQNTGQVTGTGTTNVLPIWADGPGGVLGDSPISSTSSTTTISEKLSVESLISQEKLGFSTYIGLETGISDGSYPTGAAGNYNLGIGYKVLNNYSIGDLGGVATPGENVGLGNESLQQLTTGTNNIGIGAFAGKGLTTGRNNIAIGKNSLINPTGLTNSNIAIGFSALNSTILALPIGNVAIGNTAGQDLNNTTLDNNVFIGSNAAKTFAGTLSKTVIIGTSAGTSLGGNGFLGSVLIGPEAGAGLASPATAPYDIGIGSKALFNFSSSGSNIAIGTSAQATNTDTGVTGSILIDSNGSSTAASNAICIATGGTGNKNESNASLGTVIGGSLNVNNGVSGGIFGGNTNITSGLRGVILGGNSNEIDAAADNSATIGGTGLLVTGNNQLAIGSFNFPRNNIKFVVGDGTGNGDKSNSFEIYNNGKVRILSNNLEIGDKINQIPSTPLNITGLKNTSVITLASTTNDSNWVQGDKIGGIDFYSADGSGSGPGVFGSINYITTTNSTSGGVTGMTFNVADSTTKNVERMRIYDMGVTIANNLTVGGDTLLGNASTDLTTVTSTLWLNGPVKDKTNTLGTAGELLVSNSNGELNYSPRLLVDETSGRLSIFNAAASTIPSGDNFTLDVRTEKGRFQVGGNDVDGLKLDFEDSAGNGTAAIENKGSQNQILEIRSHGTSGTLGEIRFETNSVEAVRIDENQRVGVGTDSPVAMLDVVASSSTSRALDVQTNSGSLSITNSATNGCKINFKYGTQDTTTASLENNGSENQFLVLRAQGTTSTDGNIRFVTNGTDAMRIDENQSVGIGITSPGAKLDVNGSFKLSNYGSGNYPGTAAYTLAVDSSGNVIETANAGGTAIVPNQRQAYIISVTNKTVGSPDFNKTSLCTNVVYNRQASSSLNWSEYGKQWTPSFDSAYDAGGFFGSSDGVFSMLEESVKDVLATTGNSAVANWRFGIISYDNWMLASHEMPLAVRIDNNGASPGNGTALIKLVEEVSPKTGPPNLPSTVCVWFVDTTDTSSNMGGPIPTIVFAGKDTAYAKIVNGGNQYDAGATYTFTGNTGDTTRKYALLIEDEYYSNMRSKYLKVTGGRVVLENLPTSDPSSNGVVWNDSGTLKISAG